MRAKKTKLRKHRFEQVPSRRWRFVALTFVVTAMLLIGGIASAGVGGVAVAGGDGGLLSGSLPGGLPKSAFATENVLAYAGDTAIPVQEQTPLSASNDATAVSANNARQADRTIPDLVVILLTIIAVLGFLLIVKNRRKEDRREKGANSHLRLG